MLLCVAFRERYHYGIWYNYRNPTRFCVASVVLSHHQVSSLALLYYRYLYIPGTVYVYISPNPAYGEIHSNEAFTINPRGYGSGHSASLIHLEGLTNGSQKINSIFV